METRPVNVEINTQIRLAVYAKKHGLVIGRLATKIFGDWLDKAEENQGKPMATAPIDNKDDEVIL